MLRPLAHLVLVESSEGNRGTIEMKVGFKWRSETQFNLVESPEWGSGPRCCERFQPTEFRLRN